jgi:hypothetical protein
LVYIAALREISCAARVRIGHLPRRGKATLPK